MTSYTPKLMTKLSHEAQIVLDAFHREVPPNYEAGGLVAAILALADVVAPSSYSSYTDWSYDYDNGMDARNAEIRSSILSICEQLKQTNND